MKIPTISFYTVSARLCQCLIRCVQRPKVFLFFEVLSYWCIYDTRGRAFWREISNGHRVGQWEIQFHYEANLKGGLSINCFQLNFQNLIQDSLSQREQCPHWWIIHEENKVSMEICWDTCYCQLNKEWQLKIGSMYKFASFIFHLKGHAM